MKKQYGIIYWEKDKKGKATIGPIAHTRSNRMKDWNKFKLYKTLKEADQAANHLERDGFGIECRVISLDSVHE